MLFNVVNKKCKPAYFISPYFPTDHRNSLGCGVDTRLAVSCGVKFT